ncbi:MAG: hypothetical protein ACREEO_03095 [Phenylobacterium sp.]
MSDPFDALVAHLTTAPTDRPLDQLDSLIADGVQRRRRDARTARRLAPVQLASFCLAVVVGVSAGGAIAMTVPKPEPLGDFFSGSSLAPSTLLEGRP